MRIFFTGGRGKAGRHAVPYLREKGHRVLDVDIAHPLQNGGDFLRVDLSDAGQVFNAMTAFGDFSDLEDQPTEGPQFDAVVHFAAVPCILQRPDNETYAANVLATYNVIDAATKLGIKKIIIASSETTYGICFARGEQKPAYIPIDEEHPTVPIDSYAMSKVCNEATARSFQARTGSDIYALRINNVIEPHEYAEQFPAYVADPELRRRNIFGYIDARDLGHMVDCCPKTDGLGYEVFNVANDDTSVAMSSEEVTRTFYDGVPVKTPVTGFDTFYTAEKAKRLVGFAPKHGWRDQVGTET